MSNHSSALSSDRQIAANRIWDEQREDYHRAKPLAFGESPSSELPAKSGPNIMPSRKHLSCHAFPFIPAVEMRRLYFINEKEGPFNYWVMSTRSKVEPPKRVFYFLNNQSAEEGVAPYDVVAAIGVPEQSVCSILKGMEESQIRHFGSPLDFTARTFSVHRLLGTEVFSAAARVPPIPSAVRRSLAGKVLRDHLAGAVGGSEPISSRKQMAFAQSVKAFVADSLELFARYEIKTFAAMIEPAAPTLSTEAGYLRRDYAFLFERFYYHLKSTPARTTGVVVLDGSDMVSSCFLVEQMARYFRASTKGTERSEWIVPSPVFARGEMTAFAWLANLVAYCSGWAVRLARMDKPIREDLLPFGNAVFKLRFSGTRIDETDGREWPVYSLFYLNELRPKNQRENLSGYESANS